MFKKNKFIIITLLILIVLFFLLFIYIKNWIFSNSNTKNNKNDIVDIKEIKKEELSSFDKINFEDGEIIKDNINDISNDNILEAIEADLKKDKELLLEQKTKREKEIKELISKYIYDINNDKDIIKYIDPISISKIKKNTSLIFNSLNTQEKKEFIKELKEYWFLYDNFNPNNNDDIFNYINFIVKAWIKTNWVISHFEFKKIINNDDFDIVDLSLFYNNDNDNNKDLRLYISKNNKFNISN